jgi:hypothetical protein
MRRNIEGKSWGVSVEAALTALSLLFVLLADEKPPRSATLHLEGREA